MPPHNQQPQGGSDAGGVTIDQVIRWGDQDPMRHVNNTVYFQYCESARMAYFEKLDWKQYREQPTDGFGLVHAGLNFRRQMRYPGTVRVTAQVIHIGTRSFRFAMRLVDAADGQLAADGEAVLCWLDYAENKSKPLPAGVIDAIRRLEGNDRLGRPSEAL